VGEREAIGDVAAEGFLAGEELGGRRGGGEGGFGGGCCGHGGGLSGMLMPDYYPNSNRTAILLLESHGITIA
jgi:hypothetical protein